MAEQAEAARAVIRDDRLPPPGWRRTPMRHDQAQPCLSDRTPYVIDPGAGINTYALFRRLFAGSSQMSRGVGSRRRGWGKVAARSAWVSKRLAALQFCRFGLVVEVAVR